MPPDSPKPPTSKPSGHFASEDLNSGRESTCGLQVATASSSILRGCSRMSSEVRGVMDYRMN